MEALAITDHGNMFGVPEFVFKAKEHGILPIIGCEFYLARGSRFETAKSEEAGEKNIFHQLILAKNLTGYRNLSKLCTLGFTEGYYYKPRIDRELIAQYKEGLIATTCCLASEINQAILNKGEDEAEKIFKAWLDIFGDDYYIELQRHGIEEQDKCNEILVNWSRKYGVKMIATNDVHYVRQKDSEAQDILLCLQTGKDMDDPKRMRFENNQFFLKSTEEMIQVFSDLPEAIDNTGEIVSKIEPVKITSDSMLLPVFSLPDGFTDENEYLRFLTYEGAKKRYPALNEEVIQRIDFELGVIRNMKFAGYFLIVQDFVTAARNLNVVVGPGRGSAAGSIIAYCTGITNIDPIKYQLLFERFLNPDRISMPDIDIDFDDLGREKVIKYVVDKYGKNRVAQIVTFGTMAAKSAIRDVARVLKLPLQEANRLAKLVPNRPGTTLESAFAEVKELGAARTDADPLIQKTLEFAGVLEGCARHTGVHAAGVIITPSDLSEAVPLFKPKDSEMLAIQYEGSYAEKMGLLKMDFLGLKTLTIITDAIELISKNKGILIDPDKIPLDDKSTFELYQRGETIGTFQFESEGMRTYLKDLKPTDIEDLIAMNALYRPGPMDSIPEYIRKKHGMQGVTYIHPLIEIILKPTFGTIVYQEQVMRIVQDLAGFSKGQADSLRKNMSKKDGPALEKTKSAFVEGALKNGVSQEDADSLFQKMAKFGQYGFNRSHSAAYSILAYQTGYLKANFPAEYMASLLTNNIGNMDNLGLYMEEAKRQGLKVLGPDVNDSGYKFSVNEQGAIRFGLAAAKGVGEIAAQNILDERKRNGNYAGIFDFARRVNLRAVNKKCFESLAGSGAFDCFGETNRARYFHIPGGGSSTAIEAAISHGNNAQQRNQSAQPSLFESSGTEVEVHEPVLPDCPPWTHLEQLRIERDLIGIYISGHPLDDFRFDLEKLCTDNCLSLSNLEQSKDREVTFAGVLASTVSKVSKKGNPFGNFEVEDFTGSLKFSLFGKEFEQFNKILEKDGFYYFKGKIQNRFNANQGKLSIEKLTKEEDKELRIVEIFPLKEARRKLVREITLQVVLTSIQEDFLSKLEQLLKNHKGNTLVKFFIFDRETRLNLNLKSLHPMGVNVSNAFLKEISGIPGMAFKVN